MSPCLVHSANVRRSLVCNRVTAYLWTIDQSRTRRRAPSRLLTCQKSTHTAERPADLMTQIHVADSPSHQLIDISVRTSDPRLVVNLRQFQSAGCDWKSATCDLSVPSPASKSCAIILAWRRRSTPSTRRYHNLREAPSCHGMTFVMYKLIALPFLTLVRRCRKVNTDVLRRTVLLPVLKG